MMYFTHVVFHFRVLTEASKLSDVCVLSCLKKKNLITYRQQIVYTVFNSIGHEMTPSPKLFHNKIYL